MIILVAQARTERRYVVEYGSSFTDLCKAEITGASNNFVPRCNTCETSFLLTYRATSMINNESKKLQARLSKRPRGSHDIDE